MVEAPLTMVLARDSDNETKEISLKLNSWSMMSVSAFGTELLSSSCAASAPMLNTIDVSDLVAMLMSPPRTSELSIVMLAVAFLSKPWRAAARATMSTLVVPSMNELPAMFTSAFAFEVAVMNSPPTALSGSCSSLSRMVWAVARSGTWPLLIRLASNEVSALAVISTVSPVMRVPVSVIAASASFSTPSTSIFSASRLTLPPAKPLLPPASSRLPVNVMVGALTEMSPDAAVEFAVVGSAPAPTLRLVSVEFVAVTETVPARLIAPPRTVVLSSDTVRLRMPSASGLGMLPMMVSGRPSCDATPRLPMRMRPAALAPVACESNCVPLRKVMPSPAHRYRLPELPIDAAFR